MMISLRTRRTCEQEVDWALAWLSANVTELGFGHRCGRASGGPARYSDGCSTPIPKSEVVDVFRAGHHALTDANLYVQRLSSLLPPPFPCFLTALAASIR
jgi:hypothetical protein